MSYEPQRRLSAPLAQRAQIWRIILGAGLAAALYLSLVGALLTAVALYLGPVGGRELAGQLEGADATPGFTLVALFSFAGMTAAVLLVARLVHQQGPAALTGPLPLVRRHFLRSAAALTVVYAAVVAIGALLGPAGAEPVPNLALSTWAALLPLALLGLLVQTSAEELAFRGYLQGHLAARFRSPWVWMVLPAAVFALGHYSPQEYGPLAWLVVLWTGLFGLAAADLTARTGSIGAALGFHFMNNVVAMLLIAVRSPFSGLALYVYPFGPADADVALPLMFVDLGTLGVSWLTCRLACRV